MTVYYIPGNVIRAGVEKIRPRQKRPTPPLGLCLNMHHLNSCGTMRTHISLAIQITLTPTQNTSEDVCIYHIYSMYYSMYYINI